MLITKSRAEMAEHIRHFQPPAGHGTRSSGGYEVRCSAWNSLKGLQRTGGGADLAGGDQKISRRGAQIAMTEQQLDGAQIGPASSRWTAKACRSECGPTGLPIPHRNRTSRQVRLMESGDIGRSGRLPGNSHAPG